MLAEAYQKISMHTYPKATDTMQIESNNLIGQHDTSQLYISGL